MDIREGVWTTPGGHVARFHYREDTNDFGVIDGILAHNEYGIRDGYRGLALDVGAHIGAWSVGIALDNPDLRVVAIEPVPDNRALLYENIDANGLADRVTVSPKAAAASRRKQTVRWNFAGDEQARVHRFIGNQQMNPGVTSDATEVPGVTLASFRSDVTLVKIDCEGCEWAFLDSPAIGRVAEIVGEYHGTDLHAEAYLFELLSPTHRIEIRETGKGFGLFRAVRR